MSPAEASGSHDGPAISETIPRAGSSLIDPRGGTPLRSRHQATGRTGKSMRRAGRLTPVATVGIVVLGILCLVVWLMLPLRPNPGPQPAVAPGAKREAVKQPVP